MNWEDTQLVYHALARKNEECLILTSTKQPYACIGFAQDLKKELDLDYCEEHNIGYFRRIQLTRYIINEGLGTIDKMRFNEKGQIIDFGVNVKDIIENGEAFMTSGCPGKNGKVACNRPYGNERPSRPIRNFPFLPEENDIEMINEQLSDYSS